MEAPGGTNWRSTILERGPADSAPEPTGNARTAEAAAELTVTLTVTLTLTLTLTLTKGWQPL
jgi:hypothetical protein